MGNLFMKVMTRWTNKTYISKVILIGLDNAGKTTLLYNLKLGEVRNTIPTIGFNMELLHYKNIEFTVWDVGGQNKLR